MAFNLMARVFDVYLQLLRATHCLLLMRRYRILQQLHYSEGVAKNLRFFTRCKRIGHQINNNVDAHVPYRFYFGSRTGS